MSEPATRFTRFANRSAIRGGIVCNAVLVFFELVAGVMAFVPFRTYELSYYTNWSNLLCLISSLLYLIFAARVLKDPQLDTIPKGIKVLRFVTTTALLLTLIVVAAVLCPMAHSWDQLFTGQWLYHHFLCPVLSFLSLVLFERTPPLRFRDTFLSVGYTAVYAAVMVPLCAKGMEPPYPFLAILTQPVWLSILYVLALLLLTFLVAWFLVWTDGESGRKRSG
ncbi:MAG: hypothetical protein IJ133_01960 [Clostridia bacterium]|nr:hypothetical protein [Clostridia bacterium]